MYVHAPAMKGKMGSRTYYVCLIPLSAIPTLFTFADSTETDPDERDQRTLDIRRVPDIADYILDNREDYIFSAITAAYRDEPEFEETDKTDGGIGRLKVRLGSEIVVNDGQHRSAAIAHALKADPSLGEETIAVLLFPHESQARVRQMFSDLNRHAVKTPKSLDILFDQRDPASAAAVRTVETVPAFRGLTEKKGVALKAKSTKLFTLASIYEATRELMAGTAVASATAAATAPTLEDFWAAVATAMPDWRAVADGRKDAKAVRTETVAAHGTVVRAIGAVGAGIVGTEGWRGKIAKLADIDWTKANPDWKTVHLIVGGSVMSNRQALAATEAYLKNKLLNDDRPPAPVPPAAPVESAQAA